MSPSTDITTLCQLGAKHVEHRVMIYLTLMGDRTVTGGATQMFEVVSATQLVRGNTTSFTKAGKVKKPEPYYSQFGKSGRNKRW